LKQIVKKNKRAGSCKRLPAQKGNIMKLKNAIIDLNNQLEKYNEVKRVVTIKQISTFGYIAIYDLWTPKGDAQYQFAEYNDAKQMSGYIQALSNIINLGGRFGLEQVENILRNSKQYIRG
jgi:hypothetical protein